MSQPYEKEYNFTLTPKKLVEDLEENFQTKITLQEAEDILDLGFKGLQALITSRVYWYWLEIAVQERYIKEEQTNGEV